MESSESEIEQPTDTEKVKDTSSLEEKVETPTQDNNNLYILGSHNFWVDLHN